MYAFIFTHCMSHTLITYCNIIISTSYVVAILLLFVVPLLHEIHKSQHNSFSENFSFLLQKEKNELTNMFNKFTIYILYRLGQQKKTEAFGAG